MARRQTVILRYNFITVFLVGECYVESVRGYFLLSFLKKNLVNFAKPLDPSAGLDKPESKQHYSILK